MKPKSMSQGVKSQQGSWSWLDRVQTRLESLYETEQGGSVFLQETGRMLESQVTKVGTNVKRFYSDFMRELLLPLEVPGESQAYADSQDRLKVPALAGGSTYSEEDPRGDQLSAGAVAGGKDSLEVDEQLRESTLQAEPNEMDASVASDFEVLAPPLFQAPPAEETHEDLRVKERVTKLHLKLQEMQRIESDRPTTVIAAVQSTEELPAVLTEVDVGSAVQRNVQDAAHIPVQTAAQSPGHLLQNMPSAEPAEVPLADASADSDAADLESASETEGEAGKRDEEDLLSGNESDRSQKATWYGARGVLLRVSSGETTAEKGGWFDWELV